MALNTTNLQIMAFMLDKMHPTRVQKMADLYPRARQILWIDSLAWATPLAARDVE
jgi:hypothetical protein